MTATKRFVVSVVVAKQMESTVNIQNDVYVIFSENESSALNEAITRTTHAWLSHDIVCRLVFEINDQH